MKRCEEQTYHRVLYKCMDCENLFEDLRLSGELGTEYGLRVLFCKNCTYQALVDLFDDEYDRLISAELQKDKNYIPYISKAAYNNPYVVEFERRFDETVDPCPKCGGKLSLSAKQKCPKCLSANLKDLKEIGHVTIKTPWITHNKMKTNQPDNKC